MAAGMAAGMSAHGRIEPMKEFSYEMNRLLVCQSQKISYK